MWTIVNSLYILVGVMAMDLELCMEERHDNEEHHNNSADYSVQPDKV